MNVMNGNVYNSIIVCTHTHILYENTYLAFVLFFVHHMYKEHFCTQKKRSEMLLVFLLFFALCALHTQREKETQIQNTTYNFFSLGMGHRASSLYWIPWQYPNHLRFCLQALSLSLPLCSAFLAPHLNFFISHSLPIPSVYFLPPSLLRLLNNTWQWISGSSKKPSRSRKCLKIDLLWLLYGNINNISSIYFTVNWCTVCLCLSMCVSIYYLSLPSAAYFFFFFFFFKFELVLLFFRCVATLFSHQLGYLYIIFIFKYQMRIDKMSPMTTLLYKAPYGNTHPYPPIHRMRVTNNKINKKDTLCVGMCAIFHAVYFSLVSLFISYIFLIFIFNFMVAFFIQRTSATIFYSVTLICFYNQFYYFKEMHKKHSIQSGTQPKPTKQINL